MGTFDHDDEEYAAAVPTAYPANPPAVDAVTERHGVDKPQELGLHGRGEPDACSFAENRTFLLCVDTRPNIMLSSQRSL